VAVSSLFSSPTETFPAKQQKTTTDRSRRNGDVPHAKMFTCGQTAERACNRVFGLQAKIAGNGGVRQKRRKNVAFSLSHAFFSRFCSVFGQGRVEAVKRKWFFVEKLVSLWTVLESWRRIVYGNFGIGS
jgi:hypothetical protein